jgi:hypothetical protein
MWITVCFNGLKLFICGICLPYAAPDDFGQRHIDSVERIIGSCGMAILCLHVVISIILVLFGVIEMMNCVH